MNAAQLSLKLKAIIETNSEYTTWTVSTPHLLLLVKQAVEEEREACAQVCEEQEDEGGEWDVQQQCATAIRARGNA